MKQPQLTRREIEALQALMNIAEASAQDEGDYAGFDYEAMESASAKLNAMTPPAFYVCSVDEHHSGPHATKEEAKKAVRFSYMVRAPKFKLYPSGTLGYKRLYLGTFAQLHADGFPDEKIFGE